MATALLLDTTMRVQIARSRLAAVLAAVTPSILINPPLPVCAGIQLQTDAEGNTTVAVSDGKLFITVRLDDPMVEGPGTMLVPGRLLHELVAKCPDSDITLALANEQCALSAGGFTGSLVTFRDALPDAPTDGTAQWSLAVPTAALRGLFERVSYAAATQGMGKITMQGVFLEVGPTGLSGTASNSHVLATTTIAVANVGDTIGDVLIPIEQVPVLNRLLAYSRADAVRLTRFENRLIVETSDVTVSLPVSTEVFPNYRGILATPESHPMALQVDRVTLRTVVERVGVLAALDTRRVVVAFNTARATATIRTAAADRGAATEDVPCTVTGTGGVVGINAAYMYTVLGQLSIGELTVRYASAERALQFEEVIGDARTRHLLMPVRLSNEEAAL